MNIANALPENVQKFGEYEQFIYLGQDGKIVLTNVEIENRANAIATNLKKLGVEKGDIVGVVLSNISEIPQTLNGIIRSGAVFLPIIFVLTSSEIRYILEDSQAKVVITEEKLWPKINEAAQGLNCVQNIIVIGNAEGPKVIRYSDLLKGANEKVNVVDVADNDLAILMYTSGTTGFPKGVMLTHSGMKLSVKMATEVWPHNNNTRGLIALPMNHIFGVASCLEGYAAGCASVLLSQFDPLKVLEVIKDYKITLIGLVPTMITMMMQVYDPIKHSMESIDMIVSSGGPLAVETLEQAEKMFGVPIYQAYGMTEVGGSIARQRKDRPRKGGSTGFSLPGLELKLVDDNENEVPQGQDGEVVCRGPVVMKGYLNKPEETADALRGGWLHSGDLGRFDEEGELYLTGRKKDLIIKGGENIDPGVSEDWLYKHPAVLEVAVVGIPDKKYGEEVAAVVVLKPGQKVTEEELISYVREHLHHFMAPNKVVIVDNLPKTTMGKILKREIRSKFKEGEWPINKDNKNVE